MAYLIVNRSEGKLNFKKLQQSCITSLLTVLNNFIKNREYERENTANDGADATLDGVST